MLADNICISAYKCMCIQVANDTDTDLNEVMNDVCDILT